MDINHKKLIIYLIGVSLIFLAMSFLIGYFLGFVFEKPKKEIQINDTLLYAPHIPYIPEFQVLGVKVDPTLYRIIVAESNISPTAKNPNSTAFGYCQMIKSTRHYVEKKWDMKINWNDPKQQLYTCKRLYKEEGEKHWLESKSHWQ